MPAADPAHDAHRRREVRPFSDPTPTLAVAASPLWFSLSLSLALSSLCFSLVLSSCVVNGLHIDRITRRSCVECLHVASSSQRPHYANTPEKHAADTLLLRVLQILSLHRSGCHFHLPWTLRPYRARLTHGRLWRDSARAGGADPDMPGAAPAGVESRGAGVRGGRLRLLPVPPVLPHVFTPFP
eukprot:COSAG05_NODE_1713_length_4230_cov_3.216897_6_plen_184_part_00